MANGILDPLLPTTNINNLEQLKFSVDPSNPNSVVTKAKVIESTLAAGAATSANQVTEIAALGSLLTELEKKADLTETQPISAASLPLPSGASTSANQTNGSQKTQLVNSNGDIAEIKTLSTQLVDADKGVITNAVIHGRTTGQGGGFVDVKVNPSGALTTESTVSSSALPTGAATSALQTTGNNSLSSIDTKLSTVNGILDSISFDAFSVAYPNTTTEIYSYFSGGLSGTLKMTLTIIYTDVSKEFITSAVRS